MKYIISIVAVVFLLNSCVKTQISVKVVDSRGNPEVGFPLQVKYGTGLSYREGYNSNSESLVNQVIEEVDTDTVIGRTDSNGEVYFRFYFEESQPSSAKILLGFSLKPNREIKVEPLRDLPKGSQINISIPNP